MAMPRNRGWGGAIGMLLVLGALANCDQRPTPPSAAETKPTPPPAVSSATVSRARALLAAPPSATAPAPAAGRLPGARKLVRSFTELSPEERTAFHKLEAEFWQTGDATRRQEILGEIGSSAYGADFIPMAERILGLGDEALSLAAIDLLNGNTSAAILPALEVALRDPSAGVRQQAVMAVNEVRDDAVIGFFGKAFEDPEPNVRLSGFNALDDQSQERRIKVLGRGLEATRADVQTTAVDGLQIESTPKSVETLFPALDSPSAELREAARFSLEFQFNQTFANAAAARAWWSANKGSFDQDLAPK